MRRKERPRNTTTVKAATARLCSDGQARVRVACIGDSLTRGGVKAHGLAGTLTRDDATRNLLPEPCPIADPVCRGNFPLLLAALLGVGYDVRNFGHIGVAAAAALPSECAADANHTTPGLQLSGPCGAALKSSELLRGAASFEPHVAVLLLDRNAEKVVIELFDEECPILVKNNAELSIFPR